MPSSLSVLMKNLILLDKKIPCQTEVFAGGSADLSTNTSRVVWPAEELIGGVHLAQEGHSTLSHEQNSVEHGVDLGAGLVDGWDDGLASLGHVLHDGHNVLSHEGVQPGGGLVAEHERRVGQHLE